MTSAGAHRHLVEPAPHAGANESGFHPGRSEFLTRR
jgi:hypothetical protein